jgi:hypothetical protein
VDGVPAEVLQRLEMRGSQSPGVTYECQTADGPARLHIRIDENPGGLEISWTTSARTQVLLKHQVEVFG